MKSVRRTIMTALFAAATLGLQTPDTAAQAVRQPEPPVAIGGFHYEFLPKGKIHKFYCEAPKCVPGSTVSYTLYAPEKNPDFERFKNDAKTVVTYLSSRLPAGATLELGPQEKSEDPLFTTFDSTRVLQLATGVEEVTLSTLVFTKNVTISVISSAENGETAATNKAGFLIGLLTWSEALKQ
jgi:hypothetical protein